MYQRFCVLIFQEYSTLFLYYGTLQIIKFETLGGEFHAGALYYVCL